MVSGYYLTFEYLLLKVIFKNKTPKVLDEILLPYPKVFSNTLSTYLDSFIVCSVTLLALSFGSSLDIQRKERQQVGRTRTLLEYHAAQGSFYLLFSLLH